METELQRIGVAIFYQVFFGSNLDFLFSHVYWTDVILIGPVSIFFDNQVLLWTQTFATLQNLTSTFAAMRVFRYAEFSFLQLMLISHHFGILEYIF